MTTRNQQIVWHTIKNKRPAYRCELIDLIRQTVAVGNRRYRAAVKLQDDSHPRAKRGETVITSDVMSIDFTTGVLVTQNSIYLF